MILVEFAVQTLGAFIGFCLYDYAKNARGDGAETTIAETSEGDPR